MSEPFYIRQTSEPMTPEERSKWLAKCREEALKEGATWARATINEKPYAVLLEAWKTRPKNEGEPRFSFQADKSQE